MTVWTALATQQGPHLAASCTRACDSIFWAACGTGTPGKRLTSVNTEAERVLYPLVGRPSWCPTAIAKRHALGLGLYGRRSVCWLLALFMVSQTLPAHSQWLPTVLKLIQGYTVRRISGMTLEAFRQAQAEHGIASAGTRSRRRSKHDESFRCHALGLGLYGRPCRNCQTAVERCRGVRCRPQSCLANGRDAIDGRRAHWCRR